MKNSILTRILVCMCLLFTAVSITGCAKSPEEVREWMHDKRAPVKMGEFIHNKNFSLESKIEAVMVLTERGNCTELTDALGEPLKTDELNRIVAGSIVRMQALLEQTPTYETKVKDAAYYMLKLEVSDENRDGLLNFIRNWLDPDKTQNFFLPMEKAGRVEQKKLYELLGSESLIFFQKGIEKTLLQFEDALVKEAEREAEFAKSGKKYKIVSRASDKITANLSSILANLEELKLPGADDMVADMFIKRINAKYPDMPRTYVLPFASNKSAKLLPLAKKILTDPNYQNPTLNYYKDVMLATYFRNIQKKAGVEVCTSLLQNDRTGYIRWDCLELLTIEKGRDGFAALIQTLPDDYEVLKVPADHPQFVESPSMTFWNSLRVYCAHLPSILNNQVPLEVFRQLAGKGKTVTRMMSMACLSTVGVAADVQLLASFAGEKTDIKGWGMQVSTMGELANFTSALLEKRLAVAAQQAEAEKTKAAADAKAAAPADTKAAAPADAKAAAPAAPATK